MEHTKGKWMRGENSYGQPMVGIKVNEKYSKFRGVALVCSSKEMEANARIIAAAPEMLEALIEIRNIKNITHAKGHFTYSGQVQEIAKEAIKKLTE